MGNPVRRVVLFPICVVTAPLQWIWLGFTFCLAGRTTSEEHARALAHFFGSEYKG